MSQESVRVVRGYISQELRARDVAERERRAQAERELARATARRRMERNERRALRRRESAKVS